MELPTQVFSTHSAFPGDILKCLHLLLIRDASHLLLMSNAFAISEFHSRLKSEKKCNLGPDHLSLRSTF